jgi:hypothetical protein
VGRTIEVCLAVVALMLLTTSSPSTLPPHRRLLAHLRGRHLARPATIVGTRARRILGQGLVLTAAHVVGSVAQTKPRVHIAGMEMPATAIREGNFERVDLTLLSVDEQKSRHRRSAPSYQLSIVFRRNVILPRHNGGQTCFGHFSWHICDAALDARPTPKKSRAADLSRP